MKFLAPPIDSFPIGLQMSEWIICNLCVNRTLVSANGNLHCLISQHDLHEKIYLSEKSIPIANSRFNLDIYHHNLNVPSTDAK